MDIEHLILLVQGNEEIYNPRHPKHRNRDCIAGIWRNIARELNTTDAEVKAKWHNLRSNYMREKRKLKAVKSGDERDYTSIISWSYFRSMTFLHPTLRHKTTSGNDLNVEEVVKEEYQQEFELEPNEESQEPQRIIQQTPHSSDTTPKTIEKRQFCETTESSRKKPRANKEEGEIDKQYLKYLELISATAQEDKDADYMFLKSLIPSIKKLGPLENLDFRAEVINLLKRKLEAASTPPYLSSNSPSVASSHSNTYPRPFSADNIPETETSTK